MELMLAIAAGAGLVTGIATTRIFSGRRQTPAVLPEAVPEPAAQELRTLRALCEIPNVNSIRRFSLASEGDEAMRSVLESVVVHDVRAAAITGRGGMLWSGLGETPKLDAAASFAARLGDLPDDLWRVSWRSEQGIEIVAQRFSLVRDAQWLVCVASGNPVDRMRLARAAYASGLDLTARKTAERDIRPLQPSELSSWQPVRAIAEHTQLLSARIWGAGEKRFSAGDVSVGQTALETQIKLHRWSQLIQATLGQPVGTMFEGAGTRVCFHNVGTDGCLELTTATTRPHPWRRAYAAARQLQLGSEQREAS